MEDSRASRQGYSRGIRSDGPNALRLTVTIIFGIVGGLAGGILWLPMSIVLPVWFSLTLPQLFAAVFASSMAYLVAGSMKMALSRTIFAPLVVGIVFGVVNLLLFTGSIPGVISTDDLTPPGGVTTLLIEAIAIGIVAGVVVTRGRQRHERSWWLFSIAVLLSLVAVALLIIVVSAALPAFWATPSSG